MRTDDDDGTDVDGRTEDGRRRRDGRRDGRTEDDDGDEGTDTTGRMDDIYIYIVPKFQIQHWDQHFIVKVSWP